MTDHSSHSVPFESAFLDAESQQAVWFLGALVRIRVGSDHTAGNFARLEHDAERGHGSASRAPSAAREAAGTLPVTAIISSAAATP